jgi:carbamate kinase
VEGNSLIRAGEKGTIPEQMANARVISKAIVALMKTGMHIVLTHGSSDHASRIAPLVITREEIDWACERFQKVLQ